MKHTTNSWIMIDTIVLLLSKDMFTVIDVHKFEPIARWIEQPAISYGMQSKQNPTKRELQQGIYKPRLTLMQRSNLQGKPDIMLKIELSLPKLFFGNNFNELRTKDFNAVVEKLSTTLEQMGVIVGSNELSNAAVCSVHYSKNILLTDGSTPYHWIQKIKESNMKLSLDANQTDYRNEGHCYKWHCNSYEIVFYDKIKDLEKAKISEKRALEKDNAIQLNSLLKLRSKKKKREILRMEVRLNKRQKIKQLFAKLGIRSDLTLKSLYKSRTSKKVLLHYLDEIERKRPHILDYKGTNNQAFLSDLIFNNSALSIKKILQIYGLVKALETISFQALKNILSKQNKMTLNRVMKEIQEIRVPHKHNPLKDIRKHLIKYKLT